MLEPRVAYAVAGAPVFDLHTHLYAPEFKDLNLWGIDEILTYHYLVAETLRADPKVSADQFFALTKTEQADLVWRTLFVERSPLSEAASGVVTILRAFGLDPQAPNLVEARTFYAMRTFREHLEQVLAIAGVHRVVMTNDPTDAIERCNWEQGITPDPRFLAALRIDRLVNSYDLSHQLEVWIERMKPVYLAISLTEVGPIPEPVLSACRAHQLPLALMIGVRRNVNPKIGPAGDGVHTADLASLERLAAANPDVRFLVTTLSRENTHGLCVSARKFANILPFGCWWFMNNPSLVEETTLMRLEMLGPTFVPQHSDARVLDHLIYKWGHARTSVARALTRRYEAARLNPTDAQIERDARDLMGGIAQQWLA